MEKLSIIDKILELDKLRTQGDWYSVFEHEEYGTVSLVIKLSNYANEEATDIDRDFIALAPKMAEIIREQQGIIMQYAEQEEHNRENIELLSELERLDSTLTAKIDEQQEKIDRAVEALEQVHYTGYDPKPDEFQIKSKSKDYIDKALAELRGSDG